MDFLLKYWPIALLVINVLMVWISWSFKQGIPSHADIKAVEDKVDSLRKEVEAHTDEQDDRILIVEQAIKRSPTHKDIEHLNAKISEVHGDLREVVGSLNGIRRAVDLMNQHLMKEAK